MTTKTTKDLMRSRANRGMAIAMVVLLLAARLVPAAGQAPSSSALGQRLQIKFDELRAGGSFPGGTAGFALADGTSFGIATGLSDRETKTPMKPSDRLLMGSVGKTYVAAVALQLVQEHVLALDDPIEKWLGREPWFSRLPNAREIRIRHLMTHTSGLVRYEFKPQFTTDLTKQPDKIWKPEELVAYVLDEKPPFTPGAGWEYSDTNYIVLGMIMERATGKKYYDLLRERILTRLRLQDTVPTDRRTVPGVVQGYAGPNNPFGASDPMIVDGRFVVSPQFEWTGGGLACTAEDLARWARALYAGDVLKPETRQAMLTGVPARLGPESQYGLGVIIRPSPLGITYGHSGFFPGYQTEVMYFPDLKTAIAVQVNSSAPRSTGRPLRTFVLEFAQIVKGG